MNSHVERTSGVALGSESRVMKRDTFRFLLPFLSGVLAAIGAMLLVGGASSGAASRYEDLSLFTSVLNLARRHYVEAVNEHQLIRGAVNGMLRELDPHSAYLDADAYKEMQIDTRGVFHGLGIEITKHRDGYIEVVSPIEGTPADRAGIAARDQIVSICPTQRPEEWSEDCRSTKGMALFEAVRLMRGRKGSEITIHILRESFDRPQPFRVVRDVVQVVSVVGEMIEEGYAHLRVRAFQERTAENLKRVLGRLRKKAPEGLRGLVLDLRDNPGGLLDQAVEVADVWLEEGLIVYTQGREESQRQDYRARNDGRHASYPMVVLVNEGSASASEIVAGALQDQRRALVLGTGTFGKGSVQTIYPLDDGSALRLTTARYYTPSGRSIQEVGIEPDIVVKPAVGKTAGDELPRRLRERDLEGHLIHEGSGTRSEQTRDGPSGTSTEDLAVQSSEGPDLQLVRALEVLKSWTYFDRLRQPEVTSAVQAEVRP